MNRTAKLIAKALRPSVTIRNFIDEVLPLLEADDPAFDRARFLDAAGIAGGITPSGSSRNDGSIAARVRDLGDPSHTPPDPPTRRRIRE